MKVKYALAPKCQVHNLLCDWYFKFLYHLVKSYNFFTQAELRTKENQLTNLQEILKSQQVESSKAKEELTSALSVMEQLKEGFKKERADWTTEKALLTKKAENAEAALKPVVDKLTSIKRQMHAMTSAIFGKLPLVFMRIWLSHDKSGL